MCSSQSRARVSGDTDFAIASLIPCSSLVRHASQPQPGEECRVSKGPDLGGSQQLSVLVLGYARIAQIAAQLARLRKLGRGTLGLAFECIGGRQPGARSGQLRVGAARLLDP